MRIEKNKITAEPGMILRRKSDGLIAGKEVNLGYSHYLAGEKVTPWLEQPSDYEEVECEDDENETPESVEAL